MHTTFEEAIDNLTRLMDELKGSEEWRCDEYREAPKSGVYVFYEKGKPIYVGRSIGNEARDALAQRQAIHNSAEVQRFSFIFDPEAVERLVEYRGVFTDPRICRSRDSSTRPIHDPPSITRPPLARQFAPEVEAAGLELLQ